jgi:hypothetical protein
MEVVETTVDHLNILYIFYILFTWPYPTVMDPSKYLKEKLPPVKFTFDFNLQY